MFSIIFQRFATFEVWCILGEVPRDGPGAFRDGAPPEGRDAGGGGPPEGHHAGGGGFGEGHHAGGGGPPEGHHAGGGSPPDGRGPGPFVPGPLGSSSRPKPKMKNMPRPPDTPPPKSSKSTMDKKEKKDKTEKKDKRDKKSKKDDDEVEEVMEETDARYGPGGRRDNDDDDDDEGYDYGDGHWDNDWSRRKESATWRTAWRCEIAKWENRVAFQVLCFSLYNGCRGAETIWTSGQNAKWLLTSQFHNV